MNVLEKTIGLAIIFFMVWAIGNINSTRGVVDISDLPKDVQNEVTNHGYIVFEKDSLKGVSDGTYQYKFRKFDPEYIKSLPEYMFIEAHSETPDNGCFEYKGNNGNQYIFTYDYVNCHKYDIDFKLSAIIIKWNTGFMSVVTDLVDDYSVKFNEPYYKKVNIIVQLDPRLNYSIRYYNREGEISSIIFYFYTEKSGEQVYLKVEIPSDELHK